MYYVYVIKSTHFNYTYTGMTNDIERRLNEHNCGKTKSNKKYAPFEIIYKEEVKDSKIARQRERYLKGGMGRNRLKNKIKDL